MGCFFFHVLILPRQAAVDHAFWYLRYRYLEKRFWQDLILDQQGYIRFQRQASKPLHHLCAQGSDSLGHDASDVVGEERWVLFLLFWGRVDGKVLQRQDNYSRTSFKLNGLPKGHAMKTKILMAPHCLIIPMFMQAIASINRISNSYSAIQA